MVKDVDQLKNLKYLQLHIARIFLNLMVKMKKPKKENIFLIFSILSYIFLYVITNFLRILPKNLIYPFFLKMRIMSLKSNIIHIKLKSNQILNFSNKILIFRQIIHHFIKLQDKDVFYKGKSKSYKNISYKKKIAI